MPLRRIAIAVLLLAALPSAALRSAEPVRYRLSFPEPQHRWMQVEAILPGLEQPTLELRMSRSSPGRYSLHDFAKNVYDVRALAGGRELSAARPDAYGWNVAEHGGAVTVTYKVYGDRLDGTYLAVDETHAHVNMPAAIMWARGLEDRPIVVTFTQPPGQTWRVATQLHPGAQPLEFTAANLEYLMDSPAEFGPIRMREFTVDGRTFRLSLHHAGTDNDLDALAHDAERIVREEGAIYGGYPEYEPGHYTFLIDSLPHAHGDGMEHRNSTVITSPVALANNGRRDVADTVAHEFFHSWNTERIRPMGLEPFDFERANSSRELWLAEGFTQYYGPLVLQRSGLEDLSSTARSFSSLVDAVVNDPGRLTRSAEEMSLMAPFIDGSHPMDRTNWSNTVISYYPFGGAIALALDLTLRGRTDSRVSLDDFMRAMWERFGRPGGRREGYVDRPYTTDDAETVLGDVSGDRGFAQEFFSRYIRGRDAADYPVLLERAGFAVRRRHPGRAWLGDVRVIARDGARVSTLVAPTWPVYAAGLDQDDELQDVAGRRVNEDSDLAAALARHGPGDRVRIVFVDRSGRSRTATVTLAEDPHLDVVPIDTPTAPQRAFRDRWLGDKGGRGGPFLPIPPN